VVIAMTNPVLFSGGFCRAERFLGALMGSFGRELLKEGFNCLYPY